MTDTGRETRFKLEATPITFGPGSSEEAGWELKQLGVRRALILTDPGVARTGIPERIKGIIEAEGIECEVFDKVKVEPSLESLQEAADFASEGGFDGFVGVGGGSSLDTAKVANLIATHPAPVMDYIFPPVGEGRKPPSPLKPYLAIPTTSGTGSEATTIAVMDLPDLKTKAAISHRFLRPDHGIVDPLLTASMPPDVVETLVAEGVDHVSGIVGSAFMDALDLFPDAGIDFVPVRHEQSAAHMEDAWGRITGRAGVVVGQNGPGITNMVTSVAAANMAHTPMVVISPSAGTGTIGWDGFQESDQVSIFKAITKATVEVTHPRRAADVLRTAFRIAYAERGPVLYDIPRDYFYGEIEDEILRPDQYRADMRSKGSPESLDKAAELLANAKNPVIIAGKGVVDGNAVETVKALAEYLTAPVAASYLHNDAFPADHHLAVGPLGYMGSKAAMKLASEADVVLALGCRLSVFGTVPQYDVDWFPKEARIVQVDINPKQIGRTHPIEVGIVGDANEAGQGIFDRLKTKSKNGGPNRERISRIEAEKKAWKEEQVSLAMEDGDPIHPRRALLEMSRVLPESAIVTTDIGNVCSTSNGYFEFTQPRKFIAALTFGNCGFAYPAALGAQIARPEDPVLAVVGDGAWGMSLHEVSTAVEQNLPVIACVFNNKKWGAEQRNQVDFYNNRFVGSEIDGPNFAEVGRAMGAEGLLVEDPEDVGEAVAEAIRSRRPTVLDIRVDGTQLAPPFRRDALKMPERFLEKYAGTDHRNWAKEPAGASS